MKDSNITREILFKLRSIKEQVSNVPISKEEIAKQEEELKKSVQTPIRFDEFIMTNKDIKWKMFLSKYDVSITFSLEDVEGVYMYSDTATQVTEEFVEVIKKLKSYYDTWNNEWSQKLN